MQNNAELFEELTHNLAKLYKGVLQYASRSDSPLSHGQRAILYFVTKHKEIYVKQLASYLQISSGAATQHIEALEELGYVKREADKKDKRHVLVSPTSSGLRLSAEIRKERLKAIKDMCQDIPPEELHNFIEVIKKFNDNINQERRT